MTTADGTVVGTTKIVDHGDPARRFNIVLVAEGYTAAQLTQFATHAQQFVTRLSTSTPFDQVWCAFNVYRVDVSSTDSGADDPAACADGTVGTGATPATYFDGSFCNSGIRRLLLVNSTTVQTVVNAQVPQWHLILVVVNSASWGGAGGSVATTSIAGGWEGIALHEMGHAAFGLADEYEYWSGCTSGETMQNNYFGGEPAQPNVTISTNIATNKWSALIAAGTAMPTSSNATCAQCDTQAAPVPAGTVGTFEGARYFHCGCYRPEWNCMMRNLDPFCAVCARRIRQTMAPYLATCYAPLFGATRWCWFRRLVYGLAIIVLVPVVWLPRPRCWLRQFLYRMFNCGGNADPCIEL